MSKMIGKAIGGVANGVVQSMDVDDIVQRIDMDEVLRKIDINELLDRVDTDRLIDRINLDKLVDRLPVQKIVDKSNLKEIIARSSAGVCSNLLDVMRAQAIRMDQIIQGLFRCRCGWRRNGYLPPNPREPNERDQIPCPTKGSKLAIAVQGRSAGIFSRWVSWIIDQFLLLFFFGICVAFVNYMIHIFNGDYRVDGNEYIIPFVFLGISVGYDTVMLTAMGRTIGKVAMGLLVVQKDGKRISLVQAFPRALLMSSTIFLVLFSFLGLCRRDRRGLHDVVVCTTVIYAWDAKAFRMREETLSEAERLEPMYESVFVKNDLP